MSEQKKIYVCVDTLDKLIVALFDEENLANDFVSKCGTYSDDVYRCYTEVHILNLLVRNTNPSL